MLEQDVILGHLNDLQKQAVETLEGPVLILAGAGSGKTRALTHRIANLMAQGVPPWSILAVTFTNKAANEMKARIRKLLKIADEVGSDPTHLPLMGTFHSICVRMLRRDIEAIGRDRNFVIYDGDDQEKIMAQALKDLKIAPEELKPRAALGGIGRFKCEAISPSTVKSQATTWQTQRLAEVYARYQTLLRESNALDFDDLLSETVRLLQERPEVLKRYQQQWQYLHVDEYQDTNHVQYLLVNLLAQEHRNLCVIGDPDQSIYAFRGADIRNILEFKNDYKDAVTIKLEQNYRSTQIILDGADAVIAANPNRPQKKMWTERKDGPKIVVEEVNDERMEAERAIRTVQERQKDGVPLSDQVILYRTNAQSRLFEEACLRMGVAYRIIGGVKFYARREVKDVLAYLHTVLNPNDIISLLRIINVPARKIGNTTLARLQQYCNERSLSLWQAIKHIEMVDGLNEPTKKRLSDFGSIITKLQGRAEEVPVSALTTELLSATGMEKWVRDGTDEGETRWQNILELQSVMHKYDTLEPRVSLTSFLEEAALISEVDKLDTQQGDALTLMTLHLCKGLEFRSVIVSGCEEGIFPHSMSHMDKDQLEEERRLMYVGMTRAKTHLRLLCARSRNLYGQMQNNAPSRFLDDLPDAVIERRSDELLSAFAWASERGERHPNRQSID
jgi:DNA helicase-2/ATP-dependent DNA helicase PcrA